MYRDYTYVTRNKIHTKNSRLPATKHKNRLRVVQCNILSYVQYINCGLLLYIFRCVCFFLFSLSFVAFFSTHSKCISKMWTITQAQTKIMRRNISPTSFHKKYSACVLILYFSLLTFLSLSRFTLLASLCVACRLFFSCFLDRSNNNNIERIGMNSKRQLRQRSAHQPNRLKC